MRSWRWLEERAEGIVIVEIGNGAVLILELAHGVFHQAGEDLRLRRADGDATGKIHVARLRIDLTEIDEELKSVMADFEIIRIAGDQTASTMVRRFIDRHKRLPRVAFTTASGVPNRLYF